VFITIQPQGSSAQKQKIPRHLATCFIIVSYGCGKDSSGLSSCLALPSKTIIMTAKVRCSQMLKNFARFKTLKIEEVAPN
jgi:hypothetical protein